MTNTKYSRPRIVVLGAGFGGLTFCQNFPSDLARITVVDRQNHHLFQPLLYQVATAGLSAPEIAQPIRAILSRREDVTVLMDEVLRIDLAARKVQLSEAILDYDYLVLALGGVTSYFGHPEWEGFAPGLKSLNDALRIRSRVLLAFERAETESTAEGRERLMTIVVVGGGPTGVEMAGAFAELSRTVLQSDFRRIDPRQTKVILLEAGPRLLSHLSEESSRSARSQLEALGVDVRTDCLVQDIQRHRVVLSDMEIAAENIIWTAGVSATPLARQLGLEQDRSGRIKTQPDLSLNGHPEAFAIGDIAHAVGESGKAVPGVSPAAIQMASHAARIIEVEITQPESGLRPPFRYRDKGSMATVGRSAAVAEFRNFKLSGWPAWVAWLGVHLVFLIGFRNRLAVLMHWAYSYFTYRRGARLITHTKADLESSD